ncbi:nucleoside diphosphate kinase 7 [Anthonomus grandis grandis]|uniref:nucleoside diphosphate kinase 7 n=1 Tax=Anthonomus grandis grandis TaxID=2921223 RepID=UPI00216508DD|nr:nucleoside diphosphate kinase 7 [Anthonomus grandis grandis]
MEFDYNDKLSFLAEWYDYDSSYKKRFVLNFHPSDNTLELYDRDLNRTYLKRTKMDNLELKDVFVGNTLRIYGRQVRITDYADCRTENIIGHTKQHTFALIKPELLPKLGEVITEIQRRGFQICNMKMANLTRKEVLDLFEPYKGDSFLPFILEHLISGSVVAVELVGDNAVARWLEVLGPDDPLEARKDAPNSLRAIYGSDSRVMNGFHASRDVTSAIREAEFFFPKDKTKKVPETSVLLKNTTCAVVKPHAILEGKLGHIISAINDSHYRINALQMFYLSNANADEFLEVYKGIVEDYHALLQSFVDGPCVTLEIAGKNKEMDVHGEFRMFCGPADSDIARQIRPATLRARFGCDKYKNAVHCTDLPEDTVLELEYFFKILKD